MTGYVAVMLMASGVGAADWRPADGPLKTRFASDVSPTNVHREYPRPQLVRERWLNLNGLWQYAIVPRAAETVESYEGKILVPFPVESSLSGVGKRVGDDQRLWYRHEFEIPADWRGQRILLHFGAVDWETSVLVNGQKVGEHRGGYDPFTCDITPALKPDQRQRLEVAVHDPTDRGTQPRGKQVARPEGIWYTPTTGIWQTVWLEAVPLTSIERLHIVPDVDRRSITVTPALSGDAAGLRCVLLVLDGETVVARVEGKPGEPLVATLANPRLWSPDDPFLYGLKVELHRDQQFVDRVTSYSGVRKISLGKDDRGVLRLLLNNRPLFQYGPLDQGFWPDGLYTAPTDEALRYDIEITKRLGFNMCRKHVKVEPDRWYYWCDKLGLLVWQDMPSGDKYIGPNDPDIARTLESSAQFEQEYRRVIDALRNHPSIVMWVPFNEGWGQYDTGRIAQWTRQYDPTRLVNSVSGWADRGVGDVHDIHVYPGPAAPKLEPNRAAVLGEFGGLGLPLPGHTWQNEKNWGYRSFTSVEELTAAYQNLLYRLRPLIHDAGLAAAVYTQTTDVEIEVNGLLTYDRQVVKIDPQLMASLHRSLHQPPPRLRPVTPTSQGDNQAAQWRYTTMPPADGWMKPGFNDSKWDQGLAGFGEPTTPGTKVRTPWKSPDIWLRREFSLPAGVDPERLRLLIHHDEDAEVFVNGELVARVSGYTVEYVSYPLRPGSARAFRVGGENVVAVHCHQTGGGQYIDIGFAVEEPVAP